MNSFPPPPQSATLWLESRTREVVVTERILKIKDLVPNATKKKTCLNAKDLLFSARTAGDCHTSLYISTDIVTEVKKINNGKSDIWGELCFYVLPLTNQRRSIHGVVTNVLNCDNVVSEFELRLRYYAHFCNDTIWKAINPLTPTPSMG